MNVQTFRKAIASLSTTALLVSSVIIPGMGAQLANAQAGWWTPWFSAASTLEIGSSAVDPAANMTRYDFFLLVFNAGLVGGSIFPEDITTSHPFSGVPTIYNEAVGTLYSLGVIQGRQNPVTGEFDLAGNSTITKEEQLKIVVILSGLAFQDEEGTFSPTRFTDVPADAWFAIYVSVALDSGLVRGEGGGNTFGAGAPVNNATGYKLVLTVLEVTTEDGTVLALESVSVVRGDTTPVDTPSDLAGPESISATAVDLGSRNVPRGANSVVISSFMLEGNADIVQVKLVRYGAGDEIDLNDIYLYFGDVLLDADTYRTERRTTGKSINSDTQEVVFFLSLRLRGRGMLEARADLSTTAAASAQHGFRLVSVTTTSQTYEYDRTDSRYAGTVITVSGAVVGTATMRNNASLDDCYVGDRCMITRFEFQLDSTESADFVRIALQIQGGVSGTDITNFEMFQVGRSEPVASAEFVGYNDLVTLVLCVRDDNGECQPLRVNKGDTVVFYVMADLEGAQNSESINVNVDENTDVVLVGTTLGFGLQINTTAYSTIANVLGADIAISFFGPDAGETAAGLNTAVFATWKFENNSGGRLQLRDWQVLFFNTINANLSATGFSNMALKIIDPETGAEKATLFSSVDFGSAFVTTPAAATVNGLAGFQTTITFSGSYDVLAGEVLYVAFTANIESGAQSSSALATLVDLSSGDFIRDVNNDTLGVASIKPASNIAGAVQNIVQTAIQATVSALLGNPAVALGEQGIWAFAVTLRAGSGVNVNFSQMDLSVIAGPAGGSGLNANARSTFLNLRLAVANADGSLTVVSDIETIDQNGTAQFNNLEGKLVIEKGTAVTLVLVADINTSGVITTGGPSYQFQINANSGVATNASGRNIASANIFPTAVTGQLVAVSTGGNILLNDQSQNRQQYIAQTVANGVTIIALRSKIESENAGSQLDDINLDVDTGIANVVNIVIGTAFVDTDTLTITQGVGTGGFVNGVAAAPAAQVCIITFTNGGPADNNCLDGAAVVDSTANNTAALQAAAIRGITFTVFTAAGSGTGVTLTHTAPATDGTLTAVPAGTGTVTVTTVVTGQRSGQAAALLNVTALPAAASTLIIGDSATANLCTVTFVLSGGADTTELDCSDNAATIDMTTNTTAALVAGRLVALFGLVGYQIIPVAGSTTIVQMVENFPLKSNLIALGGTQLTITVINTVPGATATNAANSMLASAAFYADGVMVATATTITTTQIQFNDLNHIFAADVPVVVEIHVTPKQVVTGGATAGQNFRLYMRNNVFRTAQGGSFLSLAGNELEPVTSALVNANVFIIVQAGASFENGGNIDSDLLSTGTIMFGKIKMNKSGTGTAEVGDGLNSSQFQLRVTKTTAVVVTSCEIRDSQNTIIATRNAPFHSDSFGTAFANQAAQDLATEAYVTWTEAAFAAGKRMTAGGGVFTIYCTVGGFNNNSSMQLSLTSDNQIAVIDNDTFVMNQIAFFLGVPVTFTARVSTN